MIEPHGGKLINRVADDDYAKEILKHSKDFKKIPIPDYKIRDAENIATGLFSPLTGFMKENDYLDVIGKMRLSNGLVWTIPITLPVDEETFKDLKNNETVLLTDFKGTIYASVKIAEKFVRNKQKEALSVFGTDDLKHPGVARLMEESAFLVGGEVDLFKKLDYGKFEKYRFDPAETRNFFEKMGWKSIAAFQTRNPIHRSHEYLQKIALEICDGLFLNPLVGETKSDDLPAEVRMRTYEVMIDNYFPKSRVMLGIFPSNMNYAGPREAVFHAICRKNYGCTHFIVGRDHAGVGNYYGTYDAQKIFDLFDPKEIGITPLKFENAFYCTKCESMATSKTCPHSDEFHLYLSGTKVREMLSKGQTLPKEFTRPEISKILTDYYEKDK